MQPPTSSRAGTIVGLGTGSTVAYLLPALAARRLDVRCVTSSSAIERVARDLGIEVEPFSGPDAPERVDLTIDGAAWLSSTTGVVEHGLFAPTLVSGDTGGSERPRRSDHDAATRR
jgi:ribose 5-phosphate isomerase A